MSHLALSRSNLAISSCFGSSHSGPDISHSVSEKSSGDVLTFAAATMDASRECYGVENSTSS